MRIMNPGFEILGSPDPIAIMKNIEFFGRTCYKSEGKIGETTYVPFIKKLITNGHESVIEHEKVTVKFICDRGVSHEIVRHRIASYSQESTRYCNYSQNKFGNELSFIKPFFWDEDKKEYEIWLATMERIEKAYFELLSLGAKPEQARSILPNSLKTEIVVTMNMREWRHFFQLRTSVHAHPQMRQVAVPLFEKMKTLFPPVFSDMHV